MSQNNNDEGAGIALVFGLIGAVFWMIGLFVIALAGFAAFVLTILCFCAWNSPLTIGPMTITPEEARGFVGRGVFGAFAVPAFVLFSDILFGLGVDWNYAFHIAAFGYVLGSIGFEILMAESQNDQSNQSQALPPHQQISAPPRSPEPEYLPPSTQGQSGQPFRYASWDDEEAGR